MRSEPESRRPTRCPPVLAAALGLLLASAAGAQPPAPVQDELVVVEQSILLQRAERTRVENLQVEIDGSLAQALAVYPLAEIEFASVFYFDLCPSSFTRLASAAGMVATVGPRLQAAGPLSVVAAGNGGERVLLAASRDSLSFEAALARVLRSPLGGCDDSDPLAGLGRLRRALDGLDAESTAPSLLVAYGFDHARLTPDDLARYQPEFAAVGAELAGEGRSLVVLAPAEGSTRLRQEEVRPLLGDPEGPPRTINLAAVLGSLLWPKRIVPEDPRVVEVAIDPRNELVRELVAPSHGRLFAFPRQLEAFAQNLADYHVLFYRSTFRRVDAGQTLVPIEIRTRSGEPIDAARLVGRPPAARAAGGSGSR